MQALLEDQALIDDLIEGSEEAFRTLVELFQHRVYNTSMGLLRSESEAEDITQEVFIEVFQSIDKFKGEAKLSTWIYRITVTKSLELMRYKKRKKRFAPILSLFNSDGEQMVEPPDFVHPGVKLEQKENAAMLFGAIDRLPESQQTAFTLHKIQGLSYQEISGIMDTTLSSVESLMHRAKSNLKKHLTKFYYESR
ncbi:MAG: RNA polymerase sigma factor [Cyclobacteriaceae bacterium]